MESAAADLNPGNASPQGHPPCKGGSNHGRIFIAVRAIALQSRSSFKAGQAQSSILIPRSPQTGRRQVKSVITRPIRNLQRNVLAGILTIGPLFVTYLIFSFVLGSLAKAGLPMVQLFESVFPQDWLRQAWVQSVVAIVLTLIMLYVVGRVTSLVIGRQAFSLFEAVLERLPFIAKVYTSVRQLLDTM